MKVFRSVTQPFNPDEDLLIKMNQFKMMVNNCIRIGINNNCYTHMRLVKLCYKELDNFDIQTSYKLYAIVEALYRLKSYKSVLKKNKRVRVPYVKKPYLTNGYYFHVNNMLLTIPNKRWIPKHILLNEFVSKKLSDVDTKIISFSISLKSLSIRYSKNIKTIKCESVIGIDRNLRNVTVGNNSFMTIYKTNKLLSMKENTIHARAGFKRNDYRMLRKQFQKYNQRLQHRTNQFLHKISKDIVKNAVATRSIIVLENLKGIRKLYRRGNGQGNDYRRKMNGWPFYELQRQIQYKAQWEGIPVDFIDPKCTSKQCPICGKRIQEDLYNRRKLWCSNCKKSMDRDVVASLNISYKGWARFNHPRGLGNELMNNDLSNMKIIRVDPSKNMFVTYLEPL